MSRKQIAGYILDRKIGKGSYATVWKGRVEGRNELVAVKVISRQTVTETAQLRQEVEVLRRISHTNIVRFRDLKKSAAHFYLVLEYCAGGDLSQFLRSHGHVAEEQARRFLTQIAAGLRVLHRENVLHRDLKPQNILLSDDCEDPVLKIADFGFARALQPQDMAATVCGSPLYMAPEILRHEPYDAKADLWSVGAILFELLTGGPPFSGTNPMQLLANIERADGVTFNGVTVSAECQEFLGALLRRCPAQRLSSAAFASHAYVQTAAAAATTAACTPEGASPLESREWCVTSADTSTASPREVGSLLREATSPASGAVPAGQRPGTKTEQDHISSQAAVAQLVSGSGRGEGPQKEGDASSVHMNVVLPEEPEAVARAFTAGSRIGEELAEEPQSNSSNIPTQAAAGTEVIAAPTRAGNRPGCTAEEEYVLVTAQPPVSLWTKGRGPTPSAAARDFCGNLARAAGTLEQLAKRLLQDSPLEALALLLRALGLLEKALTVSIEEEAGEPLKQSFSRMLQAAEDVAEQVRASSQLPVGMGTLLSPARPNGILFDFAVQQAKDAAVALSKGHEIGGWEAPCHERLTLALLLLDLLGSEADGEDFAMIQSYAAPIAQILAGIERLQRPTCGAAVADAALPVVR